MQNHPSSLPYLSDQPSLESLPLPGAESGFSAAPLKIMMIYQDFAVMGGIERYLLQTTKFLAQDDRFQPIVACTEGGPLFRQMEALGITVFGLPNRTFFAKSFLRTLDIFSLIKMACLLKQEKPDLVHVHMGLQENILLKKLGFPVVYTFHGYGTLYSMADAQNPIKRAFKWLSRGWFQQTARGMDAMLIVSNAERNRLITEGYLPEDSQAQVVHNGMNLVEWQAKVEATDRQAMRLQWGIPEGAPCVVYYNRLDFNKSPLHFVALAQKLTQDAQVKNAPIPYFLMAGDGPMEGAVRAESASLSNFNYIGLCENIPGLLAVADLVIHPASREGFGLGVIEAMAAGVPLVAYDCGGPQEILQPPETGHLLVPVNDVDALANKASALLASPATDKSALASALKRRAGDFGIARFQENLTRVYHRLLPKVSVILPVFNGEETILRAVTSVLQQSYPHLELMVVDDGSRDNTLALLSTVQDPRLRVLSQRNQGVAVARNLAFESATGEWIGFIDADDVWLPNKLATEIETMRRQTSGQHPACLIYSGYFAVNDQDVLIHKAPVNTLQGDLSQAVLAQEGLFLPSTSLVHRTIFETVGGFKPGCYHEDRVFFIEACRHFPAFPTGERLVLYRQSLSGRCRSILKDYDQALTAELSIVETLRPILPPAELATLTDWQKRNLLYRFLMYNYLPHAQRLLAEIRASGLANGYPTESLLQGNKGRLAKISLACGVNFMFAARLFIQGLTQTLIAPLWSLRMKTRLVSGSLASPKPNAHSTQVTATPSS